MVVMVAGIEDSKVARFPRLHDDRPLRLDVSRGLRLVCKCNPGVLLSRGGMQRWMWITWSKPPKRTTGSATDKACLPESDCVGFTHRQAATQANWQGRNKHRYVDGILGVELSENSEVVVTASQDG